MVRDFLRHLFPQRIRTQNLKISYTFCLGGLTFTSFLILSLTGSFLLFFYQPVPAAAFASLRALETEMIFGRLLRNLHRWSSHALLILLLLHLLRVVLTGAFRPPREGNWLVGVALLFLCLFAAYSGYFLPLDQLGFWATQTGMTLLEKLPLGGVLRHTLVPDFLGGPLHLLRFYVFHVALIPLAVLGLSLLHFYLIRKTKGLLPYL